jgi:dTDP-4-dehydrorhamnose 3,5-epimerase
LDIHRDNRGFFMRTYDKDFFAPQGLPVDWIQESHSFSAQKGTVRGLHFQRPPYAETKLVRIVQGKAFIALVDLRKGSPHFGLWDSVILAASDPELLYVPKGLALGMCTMTSDCSLLYKMDTGYNPQSAGTINWADKDLGISWPLEGVPVISDKDAGAMSFAEFVLKEKGLAC